MKTASKSVRALLVASTFLTSLTPAHGMWSDQQEQQQQKRPQPQYQQQLQPAQQPQNHQPQYQQQQQQQYQQQQYQQQLQPVQPPQYQQQQQSQREIALFERLDRLVADRNGRFPTLTQSSVRQLTQEEQLILSERNNLRYAVERLTGDLTVFDSPEFHRQLHLFTQGAGDEVVKQLPQNSSPAAFARAFKESLETRIKNRYKQHLQVYWDDRQIRESYNLFEETAFKLIESEEAKQCILYFGKYHELMQLLRKRIDDFLTQAKDSFDQRMGHQCFLALREEEKSNTPQGQTGNASQKSNDDKSQRPEKNGQAQQGAPKTTLIVVRENTSLQQAQEALSGGAWQRADIKRPQLDVLQFFLQNLERLTLRQQDSVLFHAMIYYVRNPQQAERAIQNPRWLIDTVIRVNPEYLHFLPPTIQRSITADDLSRLGRNAPLNPWNTEDLSEQNARLELNQGEGDSSTNTCISTTVARQQPQEEEAAREREWKRLAQLREQEMQEEANARQQQQEEKAAREREWKRQADLRQQEIDREERALEQQRRQAVLVGAPYQWNADAISTAVTADFVAQLPMPDLLEELLRNPHVDLLSREAAEALFNRQGELNPHNTRALDALRRLDERHHFSRQTEGEEEQQENTPQGASSEGSQDEDSDHESEAAFQQTLVSRKAAKEASAETLVFLTPEHVEELDLEVVVGFMQNPQSTQILSQNVRQALVTRAGELDDKETLNTNFLFSFTEQDAPQNLALPNTPPSMKRSLVQSTVQNAAKKGKQLLNSLGSSLRFWRGNGKGGDGGKPLQ